MIAYCQKSNGVAMILVLWVIMVLSLMVSGFAFTMHVETRVASFNRKQLKAEMLARSGIEIARMQLITDPDSIQGGGNQPNINGESEIDMFKDHALGEGRFTLNIIGEDGKFPINQASPEQLSRLLYLLDVDSVDADVIVDSILDWIDEDDLHKLNGAESDYYMNLSPPYESKDAPLDRPEEILLIRGMTPEIYYGNPDLDAEEEGEIHPGLVDLLTTAPSNLINVNAASELVLQAWLGLDDVAVSFVLRHRDGPDEILGTEDDQLFHSVEEFISFLSGFTAEELQFVRSRAAVTSTIFSVKSVGEVNGVKKTIKASLQLDANTAYITSWEEMAGDI